jgi:Group 4 capsule polysaccharide lipoprotein gfcB, YjbF
LRLHLQYPAWLAVLCVTLCLGGCADSSSLFFGTVRDLYASGTLGGAQDKIPARPDLRYRYLRVEVKGSPPAMLVLGFIDPHPDGPIEVWYSADREALRLQNGRIVGLSGSAKDWLNVQLIPAPKPWMALEPEGMSFVRRRDEMPGYRYGIADQVMVRPYVGIPQIELPRSLSADKAATYRWFREDAVQTSGQKGPALPAAWFAWGMHRGTYGIVYSEQCVAPEICIRIQPWPVMDEAP